MQMLEWFPAKTDTITVDRGNIVNGVARWEGIDIDNASLLSNVLQDIEACQVMSEEWIADFQRKFPLFDDGQGVSWSSVAFEARLLYQAFICYKVLVWGEKSIPAKHTNELNFTNGAIAKRCQCFLDGLALQVSVNYNVLPDGIGGYVRLALAKNMYDALMYQLFLYIMAGDAGRCGCSLGQCERCGAEFIRDSGKRKLCSECAKGCNRTAAWRAKKEAGLHATQGNT